MPEYYGYVYLTVNKVNNKGYVGQHKGMFDRYYYGSGKMFLRAFRKYGVNNFDRQILVFCNSQDELDIEEIYHIAIYRKLYPYDLYNITDGGNGLNGYKQTQKQIDAFVNRAKENPPRKGVKLSEDQIRRQRESLKNFYKNNPEAKENMRKIHIGKKASKETREKLSLKKQKPVICIETGEFFPSIIAASKGERSLKDGISKVCLGRMRTSGGYHWKYA